MELQAKCLPQQFGKVCRMTRLFRVFGENRHHTVGAERIGGKIVRVGATRPHWRVTAW